jgi:PKD repeat protein
MSIGGTASSTLQNALNYAYNKGVVLVAAAGNDGSTNGIDYPGAYPNVIAVGALDSSKARASYSDRGPQLDIMAPGSAVISTYTGSNSTYGSLSGTSMATPHVSAAIGLALGCMPAPADLAAKIAERDQVTAALYSTADDLGTPGWDSTFGNGLTRVDKLVLNVCPNAVPPPNQPPTASFTAVQGNSFGVNVNAASSSDPDGDALTYSWNFGDGGTATGVTAQHTYAAAGTYAIQLTVDDGHGHTAQSTQNVTPTDVIDTDPGTISVTSGQVTTLSITASTPNQYRKIYVPGGTTTLQVNLAGPACSPICNPDGDLYVQKLAKPTATKYVCRPYLRGSNESCTISNPQSGYWYMWVKRRSGTGNATLTATLS